jgi:uncharacterized protein (DUF2147 family)
MNRKSSIAIITLLGAMLAGPALTDSGHPILGVWLMNDKDSAAEFYDCGDKICARLVWLRSPNSADGRPRVDQHNPDPALRDRPLCGLKFISSLSPKSPTHLDGGKVYSAGAGKTYDLSVDVESPTRIRMHGYIGTPLLGQTFIMTRANALPRC